MKFSILLLIATAFFSFTKAEQEYKSAYTYCALSYFYDDDNYEMLLLSGGFVRNLFEKSDIYNDIDIIVNPDVSKFNTLNEMQDYLKELFSKNKKKFDPLETFEKNVIYRNIFSYQSPYLLFSIC